MENQELPKDPNPEELPEKPNLEQKNEKPVMPTEEDPNILLSGINEKIAEKEHVIEDTKDKINEIRGQLGQPPSDEIPPSIKGTQDSIEKLNQEKSEINGQPESIEGKNSIETTEKSEGTKRFENNLKGTLDDITTNSKTMLDALYERQQDRLTPLQGNENFQIMASSIKNLKNIESKIDPNSIGELIKHVDTLSRAFDDIKVQQSSLVKENPQNLEKLAFGAKKFSASAEEGGRKLPIEMEDKQLEEKSKELRKSLQKLSEQSQKLWLLAVRLRENSR